MVADFADAFRSWPIHPDEEILLGAHCGGPLPGFQEGHVRGVCEPTHLGTGRRLPHARSGVDLHRFLHTRHGHNAVLRPRPSLGRDVATYGNQVLSELLWILAIMRRAVARGEPS